MELLRYEFIDGPDDSINGMLRSLVKEIRYYRNNTPIDEFKKAIPRLKQIEQQLQKLDKEVGSPFVPYFNQIMEELDKESENERNVEEDLQLASKAIYLDLFHDDLILLGFIL